MQESFVFHRRLDRELPRASRAEGVWIYDANGKKYIDASGGPICVNVGHGRQEIVKALAEQAGRAAYIHGPMFTTDVIESLAEGLAQHAPQRIQKFYFCSSGCEAVETAIKLARQIHLANGQPQKYRVISRWLSYHGSTLGALSASGKTSMRQPFAPMLTPSIHIPAPILPALPLPSELSVVRPSLRFSPRRCNTSGGPPDNCGLYCRTNLRVHRRCRCSASRIL